MAEFRRREGVGGRGKENSKKFFTPSWVSQNIRKRLAPSQQLKGWGGRRQRGSEKGNGYIQRKSDLYEGC